MAEPNAVPRSLRRRWALRALVAALACLVGLAPLVPASAGERTRPFRVYMLQWRGPTETDRGFIDYFAQEGLDAEFIVRNADRSPDRVPGFVEEIRRLQPDLVYVWGGAAPTLLVGRVNGVDPERHITDIPVVACMVADPVELGVTETWASSGRNVTGTSHVAPIEVQVRAMQAYLPLRHLAVLYNTTEPGPGVVVEKLRRLAESLGFELTAWSVPLDAQKKPQAASLEELVQRIAATKPDLLYLGPDSFLGANRAAVTRAAERVGLPTFVSSEIYLTEADGLTGLVSNYYNMGQFCGFKAEQILVRGVRPADIPFETLKRFSFIVRTDVAQTTETYPPLGLLDLAVLVRH